MELQFSTKNIRFMELNIILREYFQQILQTFGKKPDIMLSTYLTFLLMKLQKTIIHFLHGMNFVILCLQITT